MINNIQGAGMEYKMGVGWATHVPEAARR